MISRAKRTVLVTGASRGLGRAIALQFGSTGDRIAVNYRECRGDAEEVVRQIIAQGGEAFVVRADVRSSSEVELMIREIYERMGSIDVLVNNAGIVRDGPAIRMPEDAWDAVLATNLTGPFACMRGVCRIMMRRRSGHIISIASVSGIRGREGQVNYSAAKAGLIGLTKTAARELGPYNIKVNAVLPGYLPTAMGRAIPDDRIDQLLNDNLLGRSSTIDEVAGFVHYLATMDSVSGQIFNLDSRIL